MADVAWPIAVLPVNALLGWTETPGKNTIRTETETGPAKTRRRSTASPSVFTLPFILTEEQATKLFDFYENESDDGSTAGTASGSLTFDSLPHPRTGSSAVTWRFLEPPTMTLKSKDIYSVQIKLELLP